MSKRVLVVGAGFTGAVIAQELCSAGIQVLVIDQASHVAGHAHTERDPETGVMLHVFGPHIFNTDDDEVWSYVNRWAKFMPFTNRVKAVNHRGTFSFPINLHTINQFYGKHLSPREAEQFIAERQVAFNGGPRNFEEQALSMVGAELYETFFRDYTRKQWGRDPRDLPASILKRLPLRFNYDDNYYTAKYQGIPLVGYTALIEKILAYRYALVVGIEVKLNTAFHRDMIGEFDHVFYSGPVDAFFDYQCGRLGYRSLQFTRFNGVGDMQGNAVINYTDFISDATRSVEHKHFAPWETHKRSVIFLENSFETGPNDVPFYPVNTMEDATKVGRYMSLLAEYPTVTFCGRLGQYRYFDMDDVIRHALDTAREYLGRRP